MQAGDGFLSAAHEVHGLIPRSISAAGYHSPSSREVEAVHARLDAREEQMQRELNESRTQIMQDANTIRHLEGRLEELEKLVQKQKITIANQSKTISGPQMKANDRHKQLATAMHPATPQDWGALVPYQTPVSMRPQYAAPPNVYDWPPPMFDLDGGRRPAPGPAMPSASGVSAFGYDWPPPNFDLGGAAPPTHGHAMPSVSGVGSAYDWPPPKFDLGGAAPPTHGHAMPSVSGYDRPPPKFDLGGPVHPAHGPVLPSISSVDAFGYDRFAGGQFPPPPPNPIPPFTYADIERNAAEFVKRFQALFERTEMFGWTHANEPNVYRDGRLGKRVKDYFVSVSDQPTALTLLGNKETRYFLVAKAINVYIINEVLKITAVKGFDMGVDAEIKMLKKQLSPDAPISVRHFLVAAMANQMNVAKKKLGFFGFCQMKAQEHLTQLWQLIAPLTPDRSSRACTDLSNIASEAQALAVDLYSLPFEYKFEFPAKDEAFNPTEMVNRDPVMKADPVLLRSSNAKVRLGISPRVRIRNDSNNQAVVKQGPLANVLLQPQVRQREFTSAVFTKDGLILS